MDEKEIFSKGEIIKGMRERFADPLYNRMWNEYRIILGGGVSDEIENQLSKREEPVIADLGSGAGDALKDLKDGHPNIKPIAIDLFAEKAHKNVDFIQADAEHLPLQDESVDIAISVKMY